MQSSTSVGGPVHRGPPKCAVGRCDCPQICPHFWVEPYRASLRSPRCLRHHRHHRHDAASTALSRTSLGGEVGGVQDVEVALVREREVHLWCQPHICSQHCCHR